MNEIVHESAITKSGVIVPVECLEMIKTAEVPDLYAHFHEYIELLYMKKGHITIYLNGKPFDFTEGELVVINSNETHKLISIAPVSEYYVVKFTPKLLYSSNQSSSETRYVLPFLCVSSSRPRVFSKEFADEAGIPELIEDAIAEWYDFSTGYELALKGDVLKIFRKIVGYLEKKGINTRSAASGNNTYGLISDIIEYINNNYATCEEKKLAADFNISYSYFSRTFKQIMQMSFKEYINFLKINEAQRILLSTDKSITEIAQELNFSSSSHFINVFNKLAGTSPRQYRRISSVPHLNTDLKEKRNEENS